MGRFSDKKPEDPKEMSIKLPGLLHQRLKRMAETEGRSLKEQIPRCLEEAITRWEAIKGITGGAPIGVSENASPVRLRKMPGHSS
jgi:hypothetical protein